MTVSTRSSHFTNPATAEQSFGPPLIGALLRIPWEAVQQRMLERLHENGFEDLDRRTSMSSSTPHGGEFARAVVEL